MVLTQRLADIMMFFTGIMGLYFTISLLVDIHKTQRLMQQRNMSTSNNNLQLIIDDSYLPKNSSPFMKKKGL